MTFKEVQDAVAQLPEYGFPDWEAMRKSMGASWSPVVERMMERALDIYLLHPKAPGQASNHVEPALGNTKSGFNFSRDYVKLFELVSGNSELKIPCFIDYKFSDDGPPCRDIAGIRCRNGSIDIGVRGMSYYSWDKDFGHTVENFFHYCEKLNVEFIEPKQKIG